MNNYNELYITQKLGVKRPVLLLEEAEIDGQKLKGRMFLNENLFFWNAHFEGNPTMPGTYMLEMLAQSGAFLDMILANADSVPIITSITNVRFLREVKPNQEITSEMRIKDINGHFYTTTGKVICQGRTVCKAELLHVVK